MSSVDKFEIYKECIPTGKERYEFEKAVKDFSVFIENYVTNNPYIANHSYFEKMIKSDEFVKAQNSFKSFFNIYQQNIIQKYGKIEESDILDLPFAKLIISGSVLRNSKTNYRGLANLIFSCAFSD